MADDEFLLDFNSDSDDQVTGGTSGRLQCERCIRPARVCICHSLPPRPVRTARKISILQTVAESRMRIGTAALLPLVLERAEIAIVRGRSLPAQIVPDGSVLLFPGKNSISLDKYNDSVSNLIVVDGSWEGARKLLQKCPTVGLIPQVKLPEYLVSSWAPLFQARRPPANIPGARSTAEAVAIALRVLDNTQSSVLASDYICSVVQAASAAQLRFLPSDSLLQGDTSGPVRLHWKCKRRK